MDEFWTQKNLSNSRFNRDNFQAYLRNPDGFLGGSFIRTLYTGGPGLIGRLKAKGAFASSDSKINDDRYPTVGTGKVNVRFDILRGVDLKRLDGYVYRIDVGAAFRAKGMRCPKPEEALLVPAEDQQIGRGDHPLAAFLFGSGDVFIVCELGGCRSLYLDSDHGGWLSNYDFLGVCE